MADIKVKIGNLEFKNPLMVASGTFGYGEEMNSVIDVNKFGAIVTKSVTFEKRDGNQPPRIAETECGMLNSIGLANVGIHTFVKDKLPFLRKLDLPIIVNIAGNTPKEYMDILKILEDESGISGYEINLSCPNVKEGGLEFGRDSKACFNITDDLRKLTNKLLIIKLTPNSSFISEAGKAVEDAGADCVSAINTLVGMAVDIKTKKPKISRITATTYRLNINNVMVTTKSFPPSLKFHSQHTFLSKCQPSSLSTRIHCIHQGQKRTGT